MRMLVPALYHHFDIHLVDAQPKLDYTCHWVSCHTWSAANATPAENMHQFALPDCLNVIVRRRQLQA